MIVVALFTITLIGSLVLPADLLAWGPVTHIYVGSEIIRNSSSIHPAIAEIVIRYPYDYLYGCLGPDVIFGRKFIKQIHHTHNWLVGMDIVNQAKTGNEKAFAYGYVSHLACDIVAHNLFVPLQSLFHAKSRRMRHVMWELIFDGSFGKEYWDKSLKIVSESHPGDDELLKSVIDRNFLSFDSNKRLFAGILRINRVKRWHLAAQALSVRNEDYISRGERDKFLAMCFEEVNEVLSKKEIRPPIEDPRGLESEHTSKLLKKRLRKLIKRTKTVSDDDILERKLAIVDRYLDNPTHRILDIDFEDIV